MLMKHQLVFGIKCNQCTFQFSNQDDLKAHMKVGPYSGEGAMLNPYLTDAGAL